MTSKKTPPKFYLPYSEWRDELDMWLALSGTEKKEQALLIRLVSLENNELAKRSVSKLKVGDLNADDGVTKLLAALDCAFKVDQNDEDYANYLQFTNFRRKDCQDFIAS